MFPVVLQHLFESVGFGWAVRITALLSGLLSVIAVLTVTTALAPQRSLTQNAAGNGETYDGLRLAMKTLKDLRFVLLAAGSCLVALGEHQTSFILLSHGIRRVMRVFKRS